MTAVPNWGTSGPYSDADLVEAAVAGDRSAFAEIYERYADRLHDFCVGMLRDRDTAADCVQDVFCTAATQLSTLRDPERLRSWLYSIARNEALRRIRERHRETPSDELPESISHEPGPDTLAARTELADLFAEAAGGLSDRDRAVLELTYRHGLGGPDLAEALGVSQTNANTIAYRLRDNVERSLGALLVARRSHKTSGGCPELRAILAGWDGRFSVLMRKRIARHIESCDSCDEERRRAVSPAALLGAAPIFIPAPAWLRDRTMNEIQLVAKSSSITGGPTYRDGQHPYRANSRTAREKGSLLPVAAFVVALIAALGLFVVWIHQRNTEITPTDVTKTAPTPPNTPPGLPPSPTDDPNPVPSIEPPAQAPALTTVPRTPPPSEPPPAIAPPAIEPPIEPPPAEPTPEVLPPEPDAPAWPPTWLPPWPPPPPSRLPQPPSPRPPLVGPTDLAPAPRSPTPR